MKSTRNWLSSIVTLAAAVVLLASITTIVPRAQVTVPSLMQTLLGGSTTTALVANSLTDVTQNASGTTQSTFSSVNTVTIPASAFNAATRGLQCDAYGITTANGNAKDFRVFLGGATAVVPSIVSNTLSGKAYWLHFALLRSGSSTQSVGGFWNFDNPVNTTFSGGAESIAPALAEGSAIAVAVQCQNTAAAAGCATGHGLVCTFVN